MIKNKRVVFGLLIGFHVAFSLHDKTLAQSVPSAAEKAGAPVGSSSPLPPEAPKRDSCGLLSDIADYGAVADAQSQEVNVTTYASRNVIHVDSAIFSSSDVGKSIAIPKSGPHGGMLVSKITKFEDANTVEISTAPSTTLNSQREVIQWGTDSAASLRFTIESKPRGSVVVIQLPRGSYFLARSVDSQGRFVVLKQDPVASIIGPGKLLFDQIEGTRAGYRFFLSKPASGSQPPGGIVGQRISIHNQNTTNGVEQGEKFEYWSDAVGGPGGVFDVARVTIGTWQATSGMQTPRTHLAAYDDWEVAISPETDASQIWGTAVAEWNIVNRGPDDGWAPARGNPHRRNTGGLLLVPEASTFGQSPRGAIGKNALYAMSVARSASRNLDTGQHVGFYNGYLIEPNAIVGVGQDPTGKGGRAFYATGDITGTLSDRPYAPLEFAGGWTHGIRTDQATISDGTALGMAPGQMLSWVHNNAEAHVSGISTGNNIDIQLAPFGRQGIVSVSGQLVEEAGSIIVGQPTDDHASIVLAAAGNEGNTEQLVYTEAGATGWSLETNASSNERNAGANFSLSRYSNSGRFLEKAIAVDRADGSVSIAGHLEPSILAKPHLEPDACGAGGISRVSGSDQSGKIVIANQPVTLCKVSFGRTWRSPPNACILEPANSIAAKQDSTLAYVSDIDDHSWAIAGAHLEGASYYYHCF